MSDGRTIDYPSSDGERIAEHTLQFDWISVIWGNITMVFSSREDVFVAADNLIYPVEGDNETRVAPDVYVAFGRPRHHRGCYKMWEEGGIFPQVVFEVRPPSADPDLLGQKFDFYQRFGAEEYYDFDPFGNQFHIHARTKAGRLARLPDVPVYVSPRLGVRFVSGASLTIYHPSGAPFRTLAEWIAIHQEREDAKRRSRASGLEPDRPAG